MNIKVKNNPYNSKDYYVGKLKIGNAHWDKGGYVVKFSLASIDANKFDSYDECEEWLESRLEWLIDYIQDN